MYNQDYEEYIRSILGYDNEIYREIPYSSYNTNTTNMPYYNGYNNTYRQSSELEQYYPEIYKIVYPMVKKVCSNNRGIINKEIIENMVDEIYSAIEVEEESDKENRDELKEINNRNVTNRVKNDTITSESVENRGRRNTGIRDLIKILILRELLNNNNRPPMPPPRPPFHNNGRPPMRPRIYEDYI